MQESSPRRTTGAPFFLRLVTPLFRTSVSSKLQPAPQTTFILSTGRTGTVYLADLLNQVDGVVALHEPKPSRVLNAWTTAYLEGHIGNDAMAAALQSKRRKTFKRVRAARLYVESNNFIAGFADALDQVFDQPVVIHIVRDPRDFVTSLTNRGDDAGLRKFFNKFVPYWAYVPPGVKKRQLSALNRPAYRWTAINHYLREYGRTHSNYHCFRFEDIFDDQKPEELRRLLRVIGLTDGDVAKLDFSARNRPKQPRLSLLDRPSDSANRSTRAAMASWRDWSLADQRTVEAICGSLMKEYGYGTEPEWRKALKANDK